MKKKNDDNNQKGKAHEALCKYYKFSQCTKKLLAKYTHTAECHSQTNGIVARGHGVLVGGMTATMAIRHTRRRA